MFNRQFLLLLGCLVGLQSCYQDVNNEHIIQEPDKPALEVEAHVAAVAVDLQGRNIAGVSTSFSNQITMTDHNGYSAFDLDYVELDRETLTYGKSGYFTLTQSVAAFAGQTSLLHLPLITVEHSQQFLSNARASFQINDVLQVEVNSENLIIPESGELYSGLYNIEGKRLSARESSFLFKSRSPLVYQEAQTDHIIIPSIAVLINFKSDRGEALDLATPYLMSLYMRAPLADEIVFAIHQNGLIEKVDPVYKNGKLEVSTSANSMIVIGRLETARLVSGQIATLEQNSLDLVPLEIQQSQNNLHYNTRTSSNGNYRLWVANDVFNLNISSVCGHVISESKLDARLISGDIDLQLNQNEYFVYSGKVLDCQLDPVTNGYLMAQAQEGHWLTPISYDGSFTALVPYCEQEQVNVDCFDFASGEKIQTFSLYTSSVSQNNIIHACPAEENTEASVTIESDIIHFNQCVGETSIDKGLFKGMTFTVSNEDMDEVHRFARNTKGTQDFWFSSSLLLDSQFRIITIGGQPTISDYKYQEIPYREVTFNSVLFEDVITGTRSRGKLQYTIVGK